MTSTLDIRVRSAKEGGYLIEEAGEVIACRTTIEEVADWMRDRERPEGVPAPVSDEVEDFPNVLRARTGPKGFKRFIGG